MGNTCFIKRNLNELEDHPHSHGEYYFCLPHSIAYLGSPPLAWGIQPACGSFRFYCGITPTRMGNTQLGLPEHSRLRDHPHSHGEYALRKEKKCEHLGSPPLAWGIPPSLPAAPCLKGITPTRMGNTNNFININ